MIASKLFPAVLAAVVIVGWSHAAQAQTWAAGRTTPSLAEIVAIDATGEQGWPYGTEDVAGDGPTFMQQEQSLDIRTAYAVTDATDFWVRVYVSDAANAGGNIIVYVFVDADQNAGTGGGADATQVDPALVGDPTSGGYDYIIAIQGNEALSLYQWGGNAFNAIMPLPMNAAGEAGTDLDPILVGNDQHGYLQAQVPFGDIGLTAACDANLFIRSTNTTPMSPSDINAGESAQACVPVDANSNNVPDFIDNQCTSDAQCPANGLCINGNCVVTAVCGTDADCAMGETCQQGICVATGGGNCTTDAECNGLLCVNGMCVPCDTNADCGTGRSCAADGRCVTGTSMPGTATPPAAMCNDAQDCPGANNDCVNGRCLDQCTSDDQCASRACINGHCAPPCDSDDDCRPPDHGVCINDHCVWEDVQGGACACEAVESSGGTAAGSAVAFMAALAMARRRRRAVRATRGARSPADLVR